ncbi:MAG: cyclic nucleotide-binding domain-containing protein [Rhodoferax sp.]|nr:cyclic nucleotide-binding domain-containing protein [Rhodoferax sp.]MBP9929705.1 cyclic nucleotide-binding domain-containing protein [Rhodoferax sp.]HQX58449.1 cyclic nucleotide-binding domain-containing protein [Burkholderiaceae bacterium]HQZ07491.1 cyclic nucleotide-binding domain-containing protein [Burkholderiaceae bacterium]HRA61390.1 cyclic nucleotide-binding domain-containing protein [Burkholderiaceae bacterium]
MATTPAPINRADINTLLNAIASDPSEVRLGQALTSAQWDTLAAYMQPMDIAAGRILIAQGAEDRTLYFVESGMLTVHFEDSTGKIRLAAVGAGSVIGEGGFFSRMARSATVQAGSACRLWTLSPMRFSELANRQPTVALALAMALGAIMARRMVSNRRKIAIT